MNVKTMFYLCLLGFMMTAAYWVVHHPYFRISAIDIQASNGGSLKHAQTEQIFEAVRPELTGSFFTIDLQAAQKAALAQPWVKSVKMDRIAPARVDIAIEEHEAAARWWREGEQAGLIDPNGLVFQAASEEKLPELDGEYSDLAMMLEQYRVFESRLKPLRLDIKRLQYTSRASWTMMLNNGIEVRLGKENVHGRLMRFIELWSRQLAFQAAQIDYVDMRYPNGMAVKRRVDAPPLNNETE